ncbi:MAG: 4Fe-4S binding protein, partial [bacterium]|nr:4Fe-4S binding protein [bacterium]
NPVLSTLAYFRDEYEAHIRNKQCPAGVCRALTNFFIDPERCRACSLCAKNCPLNAIQGDKNIVHVIDQEKCTKCGMCFQACPDRFQAVLKISGEPLPPSKYNIKVTT